MAKSQYTKEDLIQALIKMRIEDCASTKTIIDFLKNTLGYSHTQSYEYLKWARERIGELYSLDNPQAAEETIGRYEEQIERMRGEKNWKMWSELNRELNKIKGIIKIKTDITTNGKDIQFVLNYIKPNTDGLQT